jgi:hypothetical protein
VVGDRLDTDIEGARAAGMDSLAVLTGVHLVRDLTAAQAPRRPDYIARDLDGLLEAHPAPVSAGGGSCVAGAVVRVEDGALRVVAVGDDPLDVVRASCAAAWAWADAHPSEPDAHPSEPHAHPSEHADPGPVLEALYRLEEGGPWGR